MKKAFTMVEILTCVAIIAIIVAVTMPILTRVKNSSYQAVTRSNLKQIAQGIALYRADYDAGSQGSIYEMGLPPLDTYEQMFVRKMKVPVYRHEGFQWYYYIPPDPQYADAPLLHSWKRYSELCEEQVVISTDLNFSDVHPLEASPYLHRFGIGVRLDGSIIEVRKPGAPISGFWWRCPNMEEK